MTHHIQLPAATAWTHLETVPPESRQEARSEAFTFIHQHAPVTHNRVRHAGRVAAALLEFVSIMTVIVWVIWRAIS